MNKEWRRLIENYFLVGLDETIDDNLIITPVNKQDFFSNMYRINLFYRYIPKILDSMPLGEIEPSFANGIINFLII